MTQQDLIIESLEIVADKGVDIFPLIYASYFQACPESKQFMADASPQAKGKMLEEVMRLLMVDDMQNEESYLGFETKNHEESYQVLLPMYAGLLNAVMVVMKETLGQDWRDAFNEAWQARIASLMNAIKHHSPCPMAGKI